MDTNKIGSIIVSIIMALVATALFLVIPVTTTFIVAYIFTMLAIFILGAGKMFLFSNFKSYPWVAAFPMKIWTYLVVQLLLSAIFLAIENFANFTISVNWFLLLHIILLGIVSIWIIYMVAGKETIEDQDIKVRQQVTVIRLMQADVDAVLRRNPAHKDPLHRVAEALKYSDPMTHPAVGAIEENIHRGIASMSENSEKIPEICNDLLLQIADRNSRIKMLK
jgi:hypothetical protein